MTAILLRLLLFAVIGGIIFLGVRKIWRDWKGQFKAEDKARLKRDIAERARSDVITLERDKDGTFRPPDHESRG